MLENMDERYQEIESLKEDADEKKEEKDNLDEHIENIEKANAILAVAGDKVIQDSLKAIESNEKEKLKQSLKDIKAVLQHAQRLQNEINNCREENNRSTEILQSCDFGNHEAQSRMLGICQERENKLQNQESKLAALMALFVSSDNDSSDSIPSIGQREKIRQYEDRSEKGRSR